jgi:predicted peroxiredoxin
MKNIIFVCAMAIATVFVSSAELQAAKESSSITVINLKNATNDLHAPFMALKIAKALLEEGEKVTLFLNLEGARLADKSQPLNLKYGQSGLTLDGLMSDIVKAKGDILLCPHCAEVAGIDKEDLRSGVRLAKHKEVAKLFSAADKVIDY